MDIKNLTGLEKPLEKLIETVSNSIGVLANNTFEFDAKKIKRIGNAEAEAEKIKIIKQVEGKVEAFAVLKRAEKRFALEQYNKQINIENIIAGSKEILDGATVNDEPVDKDWTTRFMEVAQNIGRPEMQKILSAILAEEVKKPNCFSLRTLDFVKNLNKNELILFKKFLTYVSNNLDIFIPKNNLNNGFLDITYSEVMQAIELGFIQPSLQTVGIVDNAEKGGQIEVSLKENILLFQFQDNLPIVNLPKLQLTVVGAELSSVMEIDGSEKVRAEKYIDDLEKYWLTKKLERINK